MNSETPPEYKKMLDDLWLDHWLKLIEPKWLSVADYITPRKETTNVETKLKSPAQIEVDRLQADRDNLKKENGRLQDENKRLVEGRERGGGKLALYIRLDGATQIKPPMMEQRPDRQFAYEPMRYYRQHVLRPLHAYGVSRFDSPRATVPSDTEEFRLIAETQAFYVYEQVR